MDTEKSGTRRMPSENIGRDQSDTDPSKRTQRLPGMTKKLQRPKEGSTQNLKGTITLPLS